MKPFDLKRALAGEPVVHANGIPIKKIIAYVEELNEKQKLIVLDHTGRICHYDDNGCFMLCGSGSNLDLYMGEVEYSGFINIYRNKNGRMFCSSKIFEERPEVTPNFSFGIQYICTIPITWKE